MSQLWGIVGSLKSEVGHATQDSGAAGAYSAAGDESDSTPSDLSPMNPPAHLQQLFDNDFVDSASVADANSEHLSAALLARVRTRLQALIPTKEDIRIICGPSLLWTGVYSGLFPTVSKFSTIDEMLGQYDSLSSPDANPLAVAALLLSLAINIVQQPSHPPMSPSSNIADPVQWARLVSDNVDELVVRNDSLACTMEGIETIMLCIRLYVFADDQKTQCN